MNSDYKAGLEAALVIHLVELECVDIEYKDAPVARKAAYRSIKNCMVIIEDLLKTGGEIG